MTPLCQTLCFTKVSGFTLPQIYNEEAPEHTKTPVQVIRILWNLKLHGTGPVL